jgi:oxygen-independent coproporphyrinogen-3 oxidase
MKSIDQLINKYNKPVPRYTSYPAVPDWNVNAFDLSTWKAQLRLSYQQYGKEGISLYIHLPYCESLCTYCGCNTRITVNHSVELPYVEAIIKEFQLVKKELGEKPLLKEVHLGGGTPTFFSPENLAKMIHGILAEVDLTAEKEFSFEGHPNNTTKAHLQALYDLGFKRVSFGIQDSDLKVQKAINRIQADEAVAQVTHWARTIGYESVNFDLIYGLPFQTEESIRKTMKMVESLRPDRIAYYSYAHVPWKRPGQRAYDESDLPSPEQKHQLNQLGQQLLAKMGYMSIGMDHFALTEDELTKAMNKGTLHRNFMGYTTHPGHLLLGLGVSAISDIGLGYGQNVKTVEQYLGMISQGELAKNKGHIMTNDELSIKAKILEIACQKIVSTKAYQSQMICKQTAINGFVEDGILEKIEAGFKITDLGTQFLRNVCAVFDPNVCIDRKESTFSKAV